MFVNKAKFIFFFAAFFIYSVFFFSKLSSNQDVVLSEQLLPLISNPKTHKRVHAATIAEVSEDHLITAYFGGTDEGKSDVKIWLSHGYKNDDDQWDWYEPFVVEDSNKIIGEGNKPCYNPVLFRLNEKTILLFFKIGISPMKWKGYLKRSFDGGETWSVAEDLSKYGGAVGPTRCKPIRLSDNTILCGSSVEGLVDWYVQMETFTFHSNSSNISSVKKSKPIAIPHNVFGPTKIKKDKNSIFNRTGIIQPTIFFTDNGLIKIVCRGKGTKYLVSSVSNNLGQTWQPVEQEISLTNGGGDCGSGIDSVRLENGNILLVRNVLPNDIQNGQCGDRSKLVLDISYNNGQNWKTVLTLEDTPAQHGMQHCYPSIIQTSDGLVHVVYTFDKCGNGNRIKHVVLDLQSL